MNKKTEFEHAARNPFKNAIRGNVKSNAQVDNFNKSQEVFKMLQSTFGTNAGSAISTSFRIPRKQSPPKAALNVNNSNQDWNAKRKDSLLNNERIRRRDLKRNDERTGDDERTGRRHNESRTSSYNNSSRKRSYDDNSPRDVERSKSMRSDYNGSLDKSNITCSNNAKQIGKSDRKDAPRQSNPFSDGCVQNPPTEEKTNKPFSNVCDRSSEESFSTRQIISSEKEIHEGFTEINDVIKRRRLRKSRARFRKKVRKGELSGKPWLFTIKERSKAAVGLTQETENAILEKISNFMEETVLLKCMDSDMSYPQYFGHTYRNRIFTVLCANFSSRELLWKKMDQVNQLGNCSSLQCNAVVHDERFFDVKVPKIISHFSEFRALCETSNNDIDTISWRLVEYEDNKDDNVRLYTIGMEPGCYEKIRGDFRSILHCGDQNFHFVSNVNNIPADYKQRKIYLQEEKEKYEN